MMKLNESRTLKVLVGEKWVKAHFDNIEPGDIFMAFEADGTPVRNDKGGLTFKALDYAEINTVDLP